ncbi:MAG: hypothetical protein WAU42_13960 [Solirubrobacteraceae bacterium]
MKARLALLIVACIACLAAPSVAWGADTLSVSINPGSPEQNVPAAFTFTGYAQTTDENGDGSFLEVDYRPSGGIGCQGSFQNDLAAAGSASTILAGAWGINGGAPWDSPEGLSFPPPMQGPGTFENTYDYAAPHPGTYLLCAYLQHNSDTESEQTPVVDATTSTMFTVTAPKVEVFTVALAAPAQPSKLFTVDYTTQTDQQLRLQSTIVPGGGLPCAASAGLFEEEVRQDHGVALNLLSNDEYEPTYIFGGPKVTQATGTEQAAGPYVICTWIEGPSTGEVDAAASTPFYVGTPPSPPPPPPAPSCVVPRFNSRMHLATVERRIRAGHCSVGPVTYERSRRVKSGEVIRLGSRPGTHLRHGARVLILVSSGRRRHH